MFFLLRVAFWLTIVLALLPSGGAQQSAQARRKRSAPTDAVVAASAAVSDMSNFCDRQPDACVVGAQAAVAIGQRAQAGAKMVYEFFNEHAVARQRDRLGEQSQIGSHTGPKLAATVRTVPASPGSQNTLKDERSRCRLAGPGPVRTERVRCRARRRTARPEH